MGAHWFDPGSSDEELDRRRGERISQSPWEFSAYSESVGDEHQRRGTTSIDTKISRYLQESRVSLPAVVDDDENDEGDANGDDEEGAAGGLFDEEDDEEDKRVTKKAEKRIKPEQANFFASSEGASFSASSFIELNLSRPLLRACQALEYHIPTPIQSACIPLALTGRDICGSAITGSGKTAAFSLPVLERLLFRPRRVPAIRVLILTPTRELAAQVHSMIQKLAQFTDIRCCLVVGGLPTKAQEVDLRSMPDIVVATPGRIIDHLRNSLSVGLDDLAVLILDEADRLLQLGFSGEIRELIRLCPKRRQTMLFSATMTEEVDQLVKLSLTNPVRLEADPSTKRPATLTEEVVRIRRMREVNQEAVLLSLCSKTFTQKVIIFCGTKQSAHRLKIVFGLAGFKAAELHGNLTQVQRLDALDLFKRQEVDFLIATDIAARGLDILGVQTVINFTCPRDITSYVHRVGRTARAGRDGYAVTFVTDNDRSLLKSIAKRAGCQLRSRIVAEKSILEWSRAIEKMEEQILSILQEEREEKVLRKAEMEAAKAENLIAYKDEILSRPPKTWFINKKEKKLIADAAKKSLLGKNDGRNDKLVSAEQAEELKKKEKRKQERERNLPRKKRRRLEASREVLENEDDSDQDQENTIPEKPGQSVVKLAYKRAKSVKAISKRGDAGKLRDKSGKMPKYRAHGNSSRKEEMQELFQNDMNDTKQTRFSKKGVSIMSKKKPKSSFKSKARYKRRK